MPKRFNREVEEGVDKTVFGVFNNLKKLLNELNTEFQEDMNTIFIRQSEKKKLSSFRIEWMKKDKKKSKN